MQQKICIKSLEPPRLEAWLESLGQPKYRAGQLLKWLHAGVVSFEEMTDLPRDFRERLDELAFISRPDIVQKQTSEDGTVKYLFELRDGERVETVCMQYKHGTSICISTQAGCKMGCAFCASFVRGATRHLSSGEMLDQILFAVKDSGVPVSSVVLMGIGEPLDNYDNVLAFLRTINDARGMNMSLRHVSLSTCGIVPRIDALAELGLQLTLSVSLHAPFDHIRDELMPVNKAYGGISALLKACRRYFQKTGRRISFEYAMIRGVNDSRECAQALARLLRGFVCHVNLIPLNAVRDGKYRPSTRESIRAFQNELTASGVNATVRRSLGGEIAAACGQLRRRTGRPAPPDGKA